MNETAEQRQPAAAYIPWKTLETATEALSASGVPRRLDRSAFPTFSGSMKGWIISAFEFLGFIDGDGRVQPRLDEWVADPDRRREIMAAILREKYPAVVKLAELRGTPNQFREEIEKLRVSGTTSQKAVRFFLAAAQFAEIDVPPTWKKLRVSVAKSGARRAGKQPQQRDQGKVVTPRIEQPAPEHTESVRLAGGGTVSLSVNASILSLTPEDREWLFAIIDEFKSYQSVEDDGSDDEDAEGDDA